MCEQVVGSVLGRRKDDKYSFIVKKFRELFEGFLNVEDGIEQGFKEADGAFPDSLGDGAMGEGGAGVRGFQGIFGDENVGVVGEMSCAARDDVMFEEIMAAPGRGAAEYVDRASERWISMSEARVIDGMAGAGAGAMCSSGSSSSMILMSSGRDWAGASRARSLASNASRLSSHGSSSAELKKAVFGVVR